MFSILLYLLNGSAELILGYSRFIIPLFLRKQDMDEILFQNVLLKNSNMFLYCAVHGCK